MVHSETESQSLSPWAGTRGSGFRFVTGEEALEADARRAAATDSPILIMGESGTGRSSLARFIHAQSRRPGSRFVEVDCRVADPERLERQFEDAVAPLGGTVLLSGVERGLPVLGAALKRFLEGGHRRPILSAPDSGGLRLILEADQDIRSHLDRSLWQRLVAWPPLLLAPLRVQRRRKWNLFCLLVEDAATESGFELPLTSSFLVYAHVVSYGWPGNVRQLRDYAQHLVGIGALADRRLRLDSDFSFFDESEVFAPEDILEARRIASQGQTVFGNRCQRSFVRALAWLQGSASGPNWRERSKASPGIDGRWSYPDVRWTDPHFSGADMCAGVGGAIDSALAQLGQWHDRVSPRELLLDPNLLPWTDEATVRRVVPGLSGPQLAEQVAFALVTGEIPDKEALLSSVYEAIRRIAPDLPTDALIKLGVPKTKSQLPKRAVTRRKRS